MSFAELYEAKKAADAAWRDRWLALQAEYEADQEKAWRRAFPKRRWNRANRRLNLIPDWPGIEAGWSAQAESESSLRRADEAHWDTLLDEAAPLEPVEQTEELTLHHTVYASTYRSQGYGCEKYTREAAQRRADHAMRHGLRAEIRELRRDRSQDGVNYVDFGVFANTTEAGWEQTQHLSGLSLREWVMACWKSHVNPRVYNPYLSPDFEQQNGIDYQGNDLRAA